MTLRILSGGAANGLVEALRARFEAEWGVALEGDFGPVGGMRDRVLDGEPVDVVILTRAIVDELAERGLVDRATPADLGAVETGVAVLAGADRPDVSTPEALRSALGAASALFVADTRSSTAGRHVAQMLAALGLSADLDGRLREHPAGQAAMAALAESRDPGALGCTQVTEILNTAGVDMVGPLPPPHALSTVYTAAAATRAAAPEAARALVSLLSSVETRPQAEASGFARRR